MTYVSKGNYDDEYIKQTDPDAYAKIQAAASAWAKASEAGDEAGKAAAHQAAETIRAGYGYSGGDDGSQYIGITSPVPTVQSSYQSPYAGQVSTLAGNLTNRQPFSYDYQTDPLYAQYEKTYRREGERAMQDTLGEASLLTGGLPSSYAVSAGQQANNYYMSQLSDIIPELYQAAYGRYSDDYNRDLSSLSALMGLDDMEYGRYRDTVSDRRYADETGYARGLYADETAYGREQDAYANKLQQAQTLADHGIFSGFRALGYTEEEIARMEANYNRLLKMGYR